MAFGSRNRLKSRQRKEDLLVRHEKNLNGKGTAARKKEATGKGAAMLASRSN